MIIVENENLDKLRRLFKEIRFHIGNSVLNGKMGKAYANDINNPAFAILIVRKYCFVSGKIDVANLSKIIDKYELKNYKIIPNDEIKIILENELKREIHKFQRYSLKKNPVFDIEKLKKYANYSNHEFQFVKINEKLADRIISESFLNITPKYKNNGIGFCCLNNNEIVGVASSNIIYKDGIEVNIKVKEEYRRKGIATTLASMLILACLEENKKISWDAANISSLNLALKLGFEYDSEYDCYKVI